jgi:hypothetical protein
LPRVGTSEDLVHADAELALDRLGRDQFAKRLWAAEGPTQLRCDTSRMFMAIADCRRFIYVGADGFLLALDRAEEEHWGEPAIHTLAEKVPDFPMVAHLCTIRCDKVA